MKYCGKRRNRSVTSQTTNIRLSQTLPNRSTFSKRVENSVGKGDFACDGQFLLFPQGFPKNNVQQTCENKSLLVEALKRRYTYYLAKIFLHESMHFNPLPLMLILGSSNSAASNDVKNVDKWG